MAHRDTHYSNTDLDLVADTDIGELIDVFRDKCHLLSYAHQNSQWCATIEASITSANLDDLSRSIERDLDTLLSVAENLGGTPLKQWQLCVKRDLNIGFECGDTWAFAQTFSHDILRRATSMGCSLSITLYPLNTPSEVPQASD